MAAKDLPAIVFTMHATPIARLMAGTPEPSDQPRRTASEPTRPVFACPVPAFDARRREAQMDAAMRHFLEPPKSLPFDLKPRPHKAPADLVRGMMDSPELCLFLEEVVVAPWLLHMDDAGGAIYDDDGLSIAADGIVVKELAACNPHRVKLVHCHFPHLPVTAYTTDARDPALPFVLQSLATFLDRVTVVWVRPDDSRVTAVYPPGASPALDFSPGKKM